MIVASGGLSGGQVAGLIVAAAIVVPFDQHAEITQQCNGFTRLRPWDFEATPPDDYPLLLHHHNYILYSSRVVKQADLVFAIYQFGHRWDEEQKARDFAFYEGVTVRDSSLSAAIQGVVAAEVGHLDLALDYLNETAFIDLRDLAFNTRDGVHLAALSGAWHVIVAGFGGLRDQRGTLSFAPRLSQRLGRVSFGLLYRGRKLRVEVESEQATYELLANYGSLVREESGHQRVVRVTVRVGSYTTDSSTNRGEGAAAYAPTDDNPQSIRYALWAATDEAYKNALRAYATKQAQLKRFEKPPTEKDFSAAEPTVSVEPIVKLELNEAEWKKRLIDASGAFLTDPGRHSRPYPPSCKD